MWVTATINHVLVKLVFHVLLYQMSTFIWSSCESAHGILGRFKGPFESIPPSSSCIKNRRGGCGTRARGTKSSACDSTGECRYSDPSRSLCEDTSRSGLWKWTFSPCFTMDIGLQPIERLSGWLKVLHLMSNILIRQDWPSSGATMNDLDLLFCCYFILHIEQL